jgi:ABC-type branched-subunit amino acid transport system ATPase component
VDEPTAGLAPRIADDVYRLLERARELGIAVMLVDQNIAEAVALADHVCVMALGRVQRAGPRESVAADLRILVQEALIGTGG